MNNFKQKFTSFLRGRNFASGLLVAIIIAAVVFVNVICYTLSSYFELYLYVPEEPDFSISDTFSEVFERASDEGGKRVTVTFCKSEDEVIADSTGSYVRETALRFKEKYPELITIRYINLITKYDCNTGEDVADELEIYKKDMKGKDNVLHNTSVIFSTDTSWRVMTGIVSGVGYADFYTLNSSYYITSYNGEEKFASMVAWVLNDNHGTAYFTVGHGESASPELNSVLTCAGYYVSTLNLKDSSLNSVPEDAELIVISNPTTDIERGKAGSGVIAEYELIKSYTEGGGDIFVTVDPYAKRLPNLYSLLEEYGISVKKTEGGEMQTVKDMNNAITTDGFTLVCELDGSEDNTVARDMEAKIDSLGGSVILKDVAPLALSGSAKPLLVTSPTSECYAGGAVVDSEGSYPIAAYSTHVGDSGKTSGLFFIPSVYLTATDAMVTNGYANKDFVYSLLDVFFERGDMPYGTNSIVYNTGLLENLTMGTAKIYTALLLSVPAILGVFGAVMLIRRKNR